MSTTIKHALFIVFISIQTICSQTSDKKVFFNKEFNWTISIPENFENVNAEEWAKFQNKGSKAIENTYGEKVVNLTKILFVIKSGKFNYFESIYQPYNNAIDGDFIKSFKNVNEIICETFKNQMPGIKIEKNYSTEIIDHIVFQKYTTTIEYPNKLILKAIMYAHLFGKKDFTVNIMYVDDDKGEQMLAAWKNSTFGKH